MGGGADQFVSTESPIRLGFVFNLTERTSLWHHGTGIGISIWGWLLSLPMPDRVVQSGHGVAEAAVGLLVVGKRWRRRRRPSPHRCSALKKK